eukprot:GFYU01002995.1.p1 GENE.GFYU01002995.1~~GFYU01002995.1.p1  ORF type:complete len:1172 (-),score=362.53 GFYU01002995.1:41-3556(-)
MWGSKKGKDKEKDNEKDKEAPGVELEDVGGKSGPTVSAEQVKLNVSDSLLMKEDGALSDTLEQLDSFDEAEGVLRPVRAVDSDEERPTRRVSIQETPSNRPRLSAATLGSHDSHQTQLMKTGRPKLAYANLTVDGSRSHLGKSTSSVMTSGDTIGVIENRIRRSSVVFEEPELENDFRDYYYGRFMSRRRISLFLIVFITLLGCPRDFGSTYTTEETTTLVLVRLCVCMIAFFVTWHALAMDWYRQHWEIGNACIVVFFFMFDLVLSYLHTVSGSKLQGTASAMLYLTAIFFLLRNSFRYTVISCCVSMVLFLILAILVHVQTGSLALYSGALFLLLAATALLMGTRVLQHQERVMYLLNDTILEQYEQDSLLVVSLLPEKIAQQLKEGEKVVAEEFSDVSVIFVDVVGFDKMVEDSGMDALICLHTLHVQFDKAAKQMGVYKVETVFGEYMATCGCPTADREHMSKTVDFAIECLEIVKHYNNEHEANIVVRIGVNAGPVTTGVIGHQTPAYNIFGDTVNVASRMKSTCEANRIHLTQAAYKRVEQNANKYVFEDLGVANIKGKGEMRTYYVGRKLKLRGVFKSAVRLVGTHMRNRFNVSLDTEDRLPGTTTASFRKLPEPPPLSPALDHLRQYQKKSLEVPVATDAPPSPRSPGGRRRSMVDGTELSPKASGLADKILNRGRSNEENCDSKESGQRESNASGFDVEAGRRATTIDMFESTFDVATESAFMNVFQKHRGVQREQKAIFAEFSKYHFKNSLPEMRGAMMISAVSFVLFIPIQLILGGSSRSTDRLVINAVLRAVMGLSAAVAFFVILRTLDTRLEKSYKILSLLVAVLATAAAEVLLVTGIVSATVDGDPVGEHTCAVLIIFTTFFLNFAGLELMRALYITAFITVQYLLVVAFYGETTELFGLLYLYFTSIMLGIFGAFSKEKMSRQSFYLGKVLSRERKKSQKLLFTMLPRNVVDKLTQRDFSLAERAFIEKYDNLTIFFSDIVKFTNMASSLKPTQLLELLNEIYSRFDSLARKYRMHKVCTIGDAFFGVSGCPNEVEMHARHALLFAIEVQIAMKAIKDPNGNSVNVRVGLHSGSAMAGILGCNKPRYLLYGTDVQHANLMEQVGIANGIVVSEVTYKLLAPELQELFISHPEGHPGTYACETWKISDNKLADILGV